jgi:hypothetical protein
MNLTQYINALPHKSALSPGHVGLATYNGNEYGVRPWPGPCSRYCGRW